MRLDSSAGSLARGPHRFQNIYSDRAQEVGKTDDSKDPQPLGLGVFSGPPAVRAPLGTPAPVGGSPGKVTRKTDAACGSASPRSLPSPLVRGVQRGAEGASKFPGAPPGRRLARSKVPWRRWLETWQRRKARSQHFLLTLTREGGEKKKKAENERTNRPSRPTFPIAAPPRARSAGKGAREELEPGPPALTSVSAPGAARSASSELRAAVPGPGSRRAACIAAAASGQPPGALHAEGRVGAGRQSPRSGRGSGARAWTAPPVAGRTLRSARLASVPPSRGACGRPTPSPAGCYLIPGWAGRAPPRPGAPRLHARSGPSGPSPSPSAAVPGKAVAAARPGEGGESGMEGEEAAGR